VILPPGTQLQHMYVRERLRGRSPGRFVEVGVGRGELSYALLDLGWTGIGYDVSDDAVAEAGKLNRAQISRGRYELQAENWLHATPSARVDLVISSMVIEHLADEEEERYFERCRSWLGPGGIAILLVPASPAHWGIEDDIAGHVRRYTRRGIQQRLRELEWLPRHVAGLTYPLSNVLLPLSNRLVSRAEGGKRRLSMGERTWRSGVRDVPLKTRFAPAFALLLNRVTLYPFFLLQKANRTNTKALVLYVECQPLPKVDRGVDGASGLATDSARNTI
jgi:SAM-dependent methyltransferase